MSEDKVSIELTKEQAEHWQPEFADFLDVFIMGAAKHGKETYLTSNEGRNSFRGISDAGFHHEARSFASGPNGEHCSRLDEESGYDHLLHAIANSMINYVKIKRNLYK